MISKLRLTKREKILTILFIMALILGISQYFSSKQAEPPPFVAETKENDSVIEKKDNVDSEKKNVNIMVDLKGAVTKPGIYQLNEGARLQDVLLLAGGALAEADLNQVNLAQKLADEMVVYIPKNGEKPPATATASIPSSTTPSPGTSTVSSTGKININTASQAELMELDGIGETKAKAIIEYREKNGSFKQLEDLMNVTGIGEKTFEKLKEKISLH